MGLSVKLLCLACTGIDTEFEAAAAAAAVEGLPWLKFKLKPKPAGFTQLVCRTGTDCRDPSGEPPDAPPPRLGRPLTAMSATTAAARCSGAEDWREMALPPPAWLGAKSDTDWAPPTATFGVCAADEDPDIRPTVTTFRGVPDDESTAGVMAGDGVAALLLAQPPLQAPPRIKLLEPPPLVVDDIQEPTLSPGLMMVDTGVGGLTT